MAEIKRGILGGIKGKVGTVVGFNFRGKEVVRAKPKKTNSIATESQLKQREKLKVASRFLSPLNKLTAQYFGAYQGTKSRTNLATSHLMLKALIPYQKTFLIDFPKVVITKGYLPPAVLKTVEIVDNELYIQWEPTKEINLAEHTDKAIVVMFSIAQELFYIPDTTATRKSGEYTTPIPENWSSGSIIAWLIFENEQETDCSTSAFLGEF